MSKKPRLSPYAGVLIEREVEGKPELQTAYTGSALNSGRAFAQAIQQAQTDAAARRVLYLEFVHAKPVVQVSVLILHEPSPHLSSDDLF